MIHPFTNKMGERYLFVEVPQDAKEFILLSDTPKGTILQYPRNGYWAKIRLHAGSYSIKTTSRDITEEQASHVVEQHYMYKEWWKNYEEVPWVQYQCTSALGSFRSLLRSLNINHCLILKVEK